MKLFIIWFQLLELLIVLISQILIKKLI